jgi:WD40 repeat protein
MDTVSQRHYRQHTDDVLCIGLNGARDICASGQIGGDELVYVWRVDTLETLTILNTFPHTNGVTQLAFSDDASVRFEKAIDHEITSC